MKKLSQLLFIMLLFFGTNSVFSQKIINQPIVKPSQGKALVYLTRSNGAMMINFRVYDKNLFIGSLEYGNYFLYECEPGQHLFWAASENRDFVEANLEADKVYVIDLEARIGAFVAAVALVPQNPQEKKHRKKLYKTVKNENSFIKREFQLSSEGKETNIEAALEKYKELKAINSPKIMVLTPDMYFENADKP
jgi:hypothetical protein